MKNLGRNYVAHEKAERKKVGHRAKKIAHGRVARKTLLFLTLLFLAEWCDPGHGHAHPREGSARTAGFSCGRCFLRHHALRPRACRLKPVPIDVHLVAWCAPSSRHDHDHAHAHDHSPVRGHAGFAAQSSFSSMLRAENLFSIGVGTVPAESPTCPSTEAAGVPPPPAPPAVPLFPPP